VTLAALFPTRRHVFAAAATAALLFIAYRPVGWAPLAFVALVWFLDELERELGTGGGAGGWRAFRLGYWFGAVVNGVVLYWMVIALWHFTPLSLAGYLASVLVVLAPQWGLTAWLVHRVRTRTTIPLWVVFPLAWTAVDWIGGHLGDVRFPWLGLGTALGSVPAIAQWAELGGARGLTLWVAWCNVLVWQGYRAVRGGRRSAAWRPAAGVAATVLLAWGFGAWRERTLVMRPVVTAAVIQPNFGFDEKRSDTSDRILRRMIALTREAAGLPGVRLVVWSEAIIDVYFVQHPGYERAIGELARELGIPIVAGALDAEFRDRDGRIVPYFAEGGSYEYYNAAFLFDSAGSNRAFPSYRKTYLVPIVERVPFVNPRWFGDLQYFGGFGHGDRFPVYRISQGGFGILICYESAFEDLARRYRNGGADFLVNITNDSWYGTTAAPSQHASHLVLRAIETRMGVARAAQTGISEFVDPLGHEHDRTELNTAAIRVRAVMTTDVRTLYVRLGDWVAALALAGTAAMLVAVSVRRNRDRRVTP
jgi:apolipoprotein N-acyltransferase